MATHCVSSLTHGVIRLTVFVGVFANAGTRAAGEGQPAYDLLEARGVQLLQNGSFEDTDREGKVAAHWGVFKTERHRLRLTANPKESKHGVNFVTFAPEKPRGLWGKLRSFPQGKSRITAWVKGRGVVSFHVGAVRKNWRALPVSKKMLAHKSSPKFPVDSAAWTKRAWDFEIADTHTTDGKTEKTDLSTFRIHVSGNISLDACSVAPVSAWQTLARPDAPKTASAGTGLRPSLTVPQFSKPPVLDGKLGEDEWRGAAAVTGFTALNSRQWTPRQAAVYVGFDEQRLYVAFRCPHEGRIVKEKPGRDARGTQQSEAIEIWLQPPGGQYYQFLGRPGGVIVDINQKGHFKWNGNWEFKEQIQDIHDEVGGILSFQKKLWTAEVAIPFSDLGVSRPKDGDTWRVNFTRDYGVAKGRRRSDKDWTTWSPIRGSFKQVAAFGSASFRRDAPAVQLLDIGNLVNGDLSVKGECGGKHGGVRVTARAADAETGKTLSFQKLDIAPGQTRRFALADTLKVNEATSMVYHVSVVDVAADRVLASSAIPFTAIAALRVTAVPVLSRKTLYLNADASRVAGLPSEVTVEASVLADGRPSKLATTDTWRKGRRAGDLAIPIGALPPGTYQAKVVVKERPDGDPLVASVASFAIPDRPKWLGNTSGVTDSVPGPWQPVKVAGDRVSVTQREYVIGPLGLPRQITSAGKALFTQPPRLKIVLNGSETRWRAKPARLLRSEDRQAAWQLAAKAGAVTLNGKLTVEFDGFALWDFTVASPAPVKVDSLAIELPLHKDRSLYARGKDSTLDDRGAFAAMLNGTGEAEDVVVAGGHFCGNGWIWPNQWCHEVFVGDDERGLSVMCETREHLKGVKRTEIVRTQEANVLRIHLIDGPHTLDGSLPYRYMWQAAPVRPRQTNPAVWHATYQRSALIDALEDGKKRNRIHIGSYMWGLKYESYPAHVRSRKYFERSNKVLTDGGTKMVPYFGTNLVTTEAPELRPFRAEWERYPTQLGTNPRGGWVVCCPQSPYLIDFKVDTIRRIIDELGFGGVYLDVSSVTACKNHYHGCGYRDSESDEWLPTVPILAGRRMYQRIYVMNKSKGRDGVLFRHGMPVAAVAGYVDVVTQGEDWCREGDQQYDRLTPEIFRAKEMRIQYGTPYTWYCFHHYYRGERHGGRIPLCTTLAYCLPHRSLPTEGHVGMWRVWDVTDRFWADSEFLPYWSPESPVRIDQRDVVGTVYLRRRAKEALLVVANWSTEPRVADVRVDVAKIGFDPVRTKLTRALPHPILGPRDRPDGDRMPNTPLTLQSGRVRLNLHGRNLELLLLRAD